MIAPASRKLGKYEIRQKLGRGGMADVYLAQDTALGAMVALKLIEHADDPDTNETIEAERRGADLQARLAAVDPRVVRIYETGDIDGYFFVAMEYIDGQDLANLMRRGPLAPEFAADVAIAVAQTLENAHNLQVAIGGKNFQGIIHGDIKPKNIRVDSHGEVRVLDFGIAKALSMSRRLTRNEFGSVPYSSPERLLSGDVNAHSDLWSLAVMLYEMVAGVQPYHADTTERLERMIRSRIPPPPAPDPCPEPLRQVLMKAMAPDPEIRYASAAEFREDLEAYRAGEPVRAAGVDLDATRRTHRGPESGDAGMDATRRTVAREDGQGDDTRRSEAGDDTRQTARPGQPVEWGRQPRPASNNTFLATATRVVGIVSLILFLWVCWSMISSYRLYQRGKVFQRQVETEQVSDLDQIWTKWTELSKDNASSWLLRGPRKMVKQELVDAAERVVDAYRNDATLVRENDWKRARLWLSRAMAIDPDKTVRGELRLCEGHIARINGASNEAVLNFKEAQDLLPKSPDPSLGLARVYIYGLKDMDKAFSAFKEAEKDGHKLGSREKAQLADGYRDRGERLWTDSRNVRGLPQEKDQIERAEQDYHTALELYQSVAPYGNAGAQIARLQSDIDAVRARLQEIDMEKDGALLPQ